MAWLLPLSLLLSLLCIFSFPLLLHFFFFPFFLFFFSLSFKPTLFGELIALRRSSPLSSSPRNDRLESENDDPREISNAKKKRNTFVYTTLWYPMKNASWSFSTSRICYAPCWTRPRESDSRVISRKFRSKKDPARYIKYTISYSCAATNDRRTLKNKCNNSLCLVKVFV